jgi:hypothetical protein
MFCQLGLILMICVPGLVFSGTENAGSRFHVLRSQTHFRRCRVRRLPFSCFASPELIFDGTKGVGSRFHVFRYRTRFRRYGGRRVSISCFVLPDSFSAVPTAPGPVFMFCAPKLIFDGTKGVGSGFHVLRLCDPFSRAPHRRWAMGCGRRTRRSLPSVHLFNAG